VSSAIHDLGYKRYVGTRRASSTRWRVIARHQLASAWKGWWRWKLAALLAVIPAIVAAVWIFLLADKLSLLTGGRVPVTLADGALPMTFGGYCSIAFVASLTVGASIIAGDVQSGAFVFYFARSTRPIDYLAGKLVGYAIVIASIIALGPVLVAIMRVALSTTRDTHELVAHLALIPEALGVGLLATLAYTAIPLGFSALVKKRSQALGLWAAYYILVGSVLAAVGLVGGLGWLASLDVATALKAIADAVFDLPALMGPKHVGIPISACVISIVGQSALALGIVYWKLSTSQKAGVGGAT
jgi:hypothetical protein